MAIVFLIGLRSLGPVVLHVLFARIKLDLAGLRPVRECYLGFLVPMAQAPECNENGGGADGDRGNGIAKSDVDEVAGVVKAG